MKKNREKRSLRQILIARFVLIVLSIIFLISIFANVLISRQFEKYVTRQQKEQVDELVMNINHQYDRSSGGWNIDYIHGLGMYALSEGYILKLYDQNEESLWDAQNHDMTLCDQMMKKISERMNAYQPGVDGEFIVQRFPLNHSGQLVGYLDVSYYSPYYLDEHAFRFLDSLNQILIIVGVGSICGAILAAVFLSGVIVKPIENTVRVTEKIADGDYHARFHEKVETKELEELSQAINHMAEQLEEQEQLRRRLTSDVAHELRTPLANVSSYLEMMSEGVWEATPQRMERCYEELKRLSGLIEDMERLRQVESDQLKINRINFDVYELAKLVREQFHTMLEQKQLSCIVSGEKTILFADRGRIQQVLTNLLSNAIRYTESGGHIRIDVEQKAEDVYITVADDGIGIGERDLRYIFERFYRVDKARSRANGGAGIGLTITKAIVEAHQGEIFVESEVGKGSKFVVKMPSGQ